MRPVEGTSDRVRATAGRGVQPTAEVAGPEVRVKPTIDTRSALRAVAVVMAAVAAVWILYLLRKPLSWLFIASFIAIAVSGPVNYLSRSMKRGVAIGLVYLGILMVPVAMLALLVPPIVDQVNTLVDDAPLYADDVTQFVNDNERLRELNQDYDITSKLQEEAAKLPGKLGGAATTLRDVGFGIVNSIFALVTILILTAFMLGGGRRWIEARLGYLPEDRAPRIARGL